MLLGSVSSRANGWLYGDFHARMKTKPQKVAITCEFQSEMKYLSISRSNQLKVKQEQSFQNMALNNSRWQQMKFRKNIKEVSKTYLWYVIITSVAVVLFIQICYMLLLHFLSKKKPHQKEKKPVRLASKIDPNRFGWGKERMAGRKKCNLRKFLIIFGGKSVNMGKYTFNGLVYGTK